MSALQSRIRPLLAVFLIFVAALLSGCAHQNARDPLEPFNRGVYAFNDTVDTVVMKPLATGYQAVLPQFVRTGVTNFFSNLDDVTVIVNSILQLKIPQAVSDTGRLLINSTIGVLGLFDIATHFGLEKHNEDFGQTLGYWGIGNGPYLMLPFVGPSTFRDGVGRWVDWKTDPVRWEDHIRTRNQFMALRIVNTRANLLDSEKVLDAAAIDRYAFLRDAYLQRRRSLVHDGNPPPEPDEDEAVAPKPRSETAPAPAAAVLVDQFGSVVAGAPAAAVTDTGARPIEPVAKPVKPADESNTETVRVRTQTPTQNDPQPSVPIGPISAVDPARVMRVWLPGSGAR